MTSSPNSLYDESMPKAPRTPLPARKVWDLDDRSNPESIVCCTCCGSTDRTDLTTGDDGFSACCDKPIFPGDPVIIRMHFDRYNRSQAVLKGEAPWPTTPRSAR